MHRATGPIDEDNTPGVRRSEQDRGRIEIDGLSKAFNGEPVYQDFTLSLPAGEFISIFGPNGCGKSTLINLISGLLPMDSGSVLYTGKSIAETNISYVFQNYREALFPWMKAIDNIRYPLRIRNVPKAELNARVESLISEFDINVDLNKYPYQLSGGQQQTVSILRAIVTDPDVLFLDEPFSALDYEMTLMMRERIQRIFLNRNISMILVSHDLEEAVQLATQVLMLTRRPTRVADTVTVDVPWPRDSATLSDPTFVAIRSHCLDIFAREVARGVAPSG